MRSAATLTEGLRRLAYFPRQATTNTPATLTLANAALVAQLMLASGLMRQESRGAHYRSDFPATNDEQWRVHIVMQRGQAAYTVATVADLLPTNRKHVIRSKPLISPDIDARAMVAYRR
jgi:succinate dehydrogenase/fumarate reductase flavoprotein subunit